MTTSTRRTFTAGRGPNARPTVNVSTRVSQSVARRAQEQIAAAQQRPNAPALAAPGGLVQRPGGEPLRPRANQSTGATPVGGVVQFNQGIATGQPLVAPPAGGGPGFNGQEQIDVPIEQPEQGREYVLSARESYRSQVIRVTVSDAGVEATVSPDVGLVAEVGDSITLTLDAVPEGLETVTVSIELRRL